jgi:hypothetical protein
MQTSSMYWREICQPPRLAASIVGWWCFRPSARSWDWSSPVTRSKRSIRCAGCRGGATDAGSMNATTTTTITSITTSERLVRARATARTEVSNAARPDSWLISAPCAPRSMVDSAQLAFVSFRPSSVAPVALSTTPNGATSATPTLARAAVSVAKPFTSIEPTRHMPSAHSIVRGQHWSAAMLVGPTRRLVTLL